MTQAMAGAFASQQPAHGRRHAGWSWWTRPRAVGWGGVVYVGSIERGGDVVIDEWATATSIRERRYVGSPIGDVDDHNNPALILEPGQPALALYTGHNNDAILRCRRTATNFIAGESLGTFGEEILITWPGNISYVSAFVYDGTIYAFCRTNSSTAWGITSSADWGLTWATPVAIYAGPAPIYHASALVGNTIRSALSTHPVDGVAGSSDQSIFYAEINLDSGDISAGGAVLGNLDGSGLPLAWDSLEVVAAPPVAGYRTWIYDVSDHSEPEVAWMSFDNADLAGTSMYHYSVKTGGVWVTKNVVAAGNVFAVGGQRYFGGAQFETPTDGGALITAREAAGTWMVEKQTTSDGGDTWSASALLTESGTSRAVVRAWPVIKRDGVPVPFDVAANWTESHAGPGNWLGNVGAKRLTTAEFPASSVS